MHCRDIIVVGASAGGVEALTRLAASLPADLPAAVFVVLHLPADARSMLPQILRRAGPLPAVHPADGAPIEHGRIYIAPPDHHLLVHRDAVRVVRGPRENGHRPAVDPLFRTASLAYGVRVVGIVLSGALDDGSSGLAVIKRRGGISIVQDPTEALFPSMPVSALENDHVDYALPVAEIGPLLAELARTPVQEDGGANMPEETHKEAAMAALQPGALHDPNRPGIASGFTCPECHGALWELHEDGLLHFRCRVGHAFSAESLLSEHDQSLEAALWAALRALEEAAALSLRLHERAHERGAVLVAPRFAQRADEARHHAEVIRRLLLDSAREPRTDAAAMADSTDGAERTGGSMLRKQG